MILKTLKFNNKNLKITYRDDSDLSVIDEFFVDKMYRSIDSIIPNLKDPILDIGAHIGMFSLYASILNPDAKIISLEPEPENFKLLKQNLKQNHCKNIFTKQVALSHTQDTNINLYISKDTHTHSTFSKTDSSIEVNTTTLEKLITQNRLGRIGLLKMDIEGAEFEIIKNIKQDTWGKIQYLVIEYHESENNKRTDLENIIRSLSFSIEHFPNHFDKRFGLLLCRNKKTG
ncbi:MAG: FkbM family methyltransferase [Candidatus Magasanikbacteria bacterium]|jgi:FkbM family methyltransferase|nr:FkbM family methyltransferase [Candidatus Magasanikbacteria bacterium]MBT4315360.1 FkbM family methyltransferase [Candidatus Magasanikbacteria bacterium]MBT4547233.1 FkbM family methyltransferase [Candidatus Magasanikbacteria bacterium]MBT6819290.1 FkbM family methyltransferase [Candidatus Magasanikbacteria bacterium]